MNAGMKRIALMIACLIGILTIVQYASPSPAGAADCLMCHETMVKKNNVHAAVQMGCESCHVNVDASDIPHKFKGKAPKGLSDAQPGLCYQCHDRKIFTKKMKHAALSMGCTACHDPHASDVSKLLTADMPDLCENCHDRNLFSGKKDVHPPVMGGMCTACHNPHSTKGPKLLTAEAPQLCFNCHDQSAFSGDAVHSPVGIGLCLSCHAPHQSDREKLLVQDIPDLCFNCHDAGNFKKKNVHAPVAAGMCLSCHSPHVSKEPHLLQERVVAVCYRCHADLRRKPHAIMAFSTRAGGHPVGSASKRKKRKIVKDPLRNGEEFSCVSCHEPHSSDWNKLFRYKADSAMSLCSYCHNY